MIAAASGRQRGCAPRSVRSQNAEGRLRSRLGCLLATCVWLGPLSALAAELPPAPAVVVAPELARDASEPATPEPASAEPAPGTTELVPWTPEPAAPEPAAPDLAVPEPAAPQPTPAAELPFPALPAPAETDLPAPGPEPPVQASRPSSVVRHGIALRLGARATTVREDLLVPLTFSGGGPDLGASYRGLVGPGLLDARVETSLALVSNRFGHLGLTLHHSLTTAYRLPLPGAGAWRFALGGVIGESSDSLALLSWDDAHGYWVGLIFVGPSASVQRQLSHSWQLSGTAELALVGTVGRPPRFRHNKQDANARVSYYLFHPFADSSFFAPWNVQLFRFDIAARRTSSEDPVGRGWSFGCQGRFTRASEPATILVFEAVLYAAWTWGM